MTTAGPIKTLAVLIERLEAVHEDLDARKLTLDQYEQLGWARRPLETLLEQCREEAESIQWAKENKQGFARVMPKGARP
jgi:hypothetical protein